MLFKTRYILLSLFISLTYPSFLLADEFSGSISFTKCKKHCNPKGEPEILFHSKIDYTLRLVIDKNSYHPVIKVVNETDNSVEWSFHIVFFDQEDTVIAAYALSGKTNATGKYGQSNSSSTIKMNPSDMEKITKYKATIYTL